MIIGHHDLHNNTTITTTASTARDINEILCTTVPEFNVERARYFTHNSSPLKSVIFQTLPLTLGVHFVTKSGDVISAYGKFCCGGVRKNPTGFPRLTGPGDVSHSSSCPFHPDHEATLMVEKNNNNTNDNNNDDEIIQGGNNNGKVVNPHLFTGRKYHVGFLEESRMTKSQCRKGASIAIWSCCKAVAVAGHNTETYRFTPEHENGCRTFGAPQLQQQHQQELNDDAGDVFGRI